MENIEGSFQDEQGDVIASGVAEFDATGKFIRATANEAISELADQMSYEAPAALTIDYKAVQAAITGEEVAACACDTCLEEAGPDETIDEIDVTEVYPYDADTADGLQMALEAVADLKSRFEALEERITLFNTRSNHKL